jgi:hypothetical protein
MSLREQVAKAPEVLDAEQEAAKAAREAEEAAQAAAEIEERVREGDPKVTAAQVERVHSESRFARLRREHAERKAARARQEAAERARREAVDAAKQALGPEALDAIGDSYADAQEALAKLVAACRAYDRSFMAAYDRLGRAGFGGAHDPSHAAGGPPPADWSHTTVSGSLSDNARIMVEARCTGVSTRVTCCWRCWSRSLPRAGRSRTAWATCWSWVAAR